MAGGRDAVSGRSPVTDRRGKEGVRTYFDSAQDAWEDLYDRTDPEGSTYADRNAAAVALARRHVGAGGLVLDAGCGPGYLSADLDVAGYRVVSFDLAPRMAAMTRERRAGGLVLVADLDRPPFPDATFDAIALIGVISYVPDAQSVFANIHRMLRPGGVLVISSANRTLLLNTLGGKISGLLGRGGTGNLQGRRADGRFFRENCTYYRAGAFNAMVCRVGFRLLGRRSIGFGRFRVMKRSMFPKWLDIMLSRALSMLSRLPPFAFLGDYAFANVACFRRL